MFKTQILLLVLLASFFTGLAQTPTQSIRGKVIDAASSTGLEGANVVVLNTDPLLGATTDVKGVFKIEKVKVGRHSIKVSYVGYKTVVIPEIMVSSGKETVLTIDLEEMAVTAGEVEIKAGVSKDKTINPMAMVSSRSFNVDETRRYAGSVDDPMRAVSNFAGVVSNPGVSSNQIMIRGNSPKGLLWRVEGMDIPNPNHFAFVGTSGGGFTIFSSQVLTNSDFYTAAFPAQFGNALSGVFDMRFRNGNTTRHEYALQLGFQGLDVAAEGPFSKKHTASYLFNYRYSVLYFLQYIDPWMKNKIPQFQDLSFKIHLPTPKAGTFSIVGIGGTSRVTSVAEKDSAAWETMEDRSQSTLDNKMGALALVHQVYVTKHAFLRSYISTTYNDIVSSAELYTSGYTLLPEDSTKHRNYRVTGSVNYNQKFGTRYTLMGGITFTKLFYELDMKGRNPFTGEFGQVAKGRGNTNLLQAFTETRIDFTNDFSVTAGLNFQYFLLNSHYALEPRIACRWQVASKHALSFGYGLHSQLEDVGIYLAEIPADGGTISPNTSLNFSRANHFVIGYDYLIRADLRLKAETYYQVLYDIPVMQGSYYSLINSTGDYFSEPLQNTGSGRNIGIDLTFEKFLTNQYYYLATVSLFSSTYRGGDGIERSTRFNSNYVINLLGGKEWTIRQKNILGVNLKGSFTGGEHYVPINLQKSIEQHREVLDEANAYKPQLSPFFYLDLTVTYRTNHNKFSGIWALQVRNLLNQTPDVGYIYNDFTRSVEPEKSLGIIPLLSYKVEF
ncbi:MAG: TonB-dependent receptor [Bacteroidetes bacterium]|nr:TonB-dependent receptor [Bacteroidota bacterium]